MAQVPGTARRFTRAEYERLCDEGFFRPGEPIELIGGELRVSEPQGSPHAVAVGLTADVLRGVFGRGWVVREEKPVAIDDESEPEPDVAVVAGEPRDYLAAHPARPVLLVEVADTSVPWDREHKGSLYARAGVGDYWIVNLQDRVLEVYREPIADPLAPFGWRYRIGRVLGSDAHVSPLARPQARVAVADLLA